MIESNDLKIILLWPLQHFWSRSVTTHGDRSNDGDAAI